MKKIVVLGMLVLNLQAKFDFKAVSLFLKSISQDTFEKVEKSLEQRAEQIVAVEAESFVKRAFVKEGRNIELRHLWLEERYDAYSKTFEKEFEYAHADEFSKSVSEALANIDLLRKKCLETYTDSFIDDQYLDITLMPGEENCIHPSALISFVSSSIKKRAVEKAIDGIYSEDHFEMMENGTVQFLAGAEKMFPAERNLGRWLPNKSSFSMSPNKARIEYLKVVLSQIREIRSRKAGLTSE